SSVARERLLPAPRRMLINLLPDFFALLDSSDPAAAYRRYFAAHHRLLEAYWLNYVIEPVGPHFEDIVRSTMSADRSDLREMRDDVIGADGNYSYWDTGRRVSLREHLINEGIAVNVSRAVSPGHAAWEYFGYSRKQYGRVRELEPVIRQAATAEIDSHGLGL